MSELDFESDSFLALLTDALRAGPGSPQWHEAVGRLRGVGGAAVARADEYRLLVVAREHLESGKSYRSVRAGPGFTRRLMASIEEQAAAPAAPPDRTAKTVAIVSGAVALVVLVIVGYLLWSAADRAKLARSDGQGPTLLVNTVTTADFSARALPADWRTIGRMPLQLTRGTLRPTTNPTDVTTATAGASGGAASGAAVGATGGGIVWNQPISHSEPFAVIASLRAYRLESDLIAQVFVTDDPTFSDDNAISPHELVWLIESNEARVILPGGRVESQTSLPQDYRGGLNVKIEIDGDRASVELGSKRLWAGSSGLDPSKPRFAGVRFLRRVNAGGADGVAFDSVRINMRHK
jgi:hypothetical protein